VPWKSSDAAVVIYMLHSLDLMIMASYIALARRGIAVPLIYDNIA
jgi:hypothetical protein